MRFLAQLGVVSVGILGGCVRSAGPNEAPTYPNFAVAADHAIASAAGAEILRAGGNAVDAAVATSFALSVVRPYSCGIGGGGFMLVHLVDDPRHGDVDVFIDYRETCPGGIGPDSFEAFDDDASQRGGLAIAVPGSVAGLMHALETYGTLDRDAVLAPAIRIAERGFRADADYALRARTLAASFEANPAWKSRFPFVWERLLLEGRVQAGSRVRLPEQAEALRLIAQYGAAAFYDGPIGDAIVEAAARDRGVLTHEDLLQFKPRERAPIRTEFFGGTLLTAPPPSSGGIAIAQVLGVASRATFGMHPLQSELASSAERHLLYHHYLAEALKHAFADRARWLGDPDFAEVPTDRLLGDPRLDEIAEAINPFSTLPHDRYGSAPAPNDDGGTSHFSVVDSRGSAVACTETINLEFGSLVAVDRYGFCLNDEMDDFTTSSGPNAFGLTQSDRNRPEPGKRPLSSMSPSIALDSTGDVLAVAGGSGGPRIISATVQVLLNALRWGDAGIAVGAPRIHHQWSPDVLEMETGAVRWDGRAWEVPFGPSRGRTSFEEFGHAIRGRDTIGVVQLILRRRDGWQAASDPRKGGSPDGG
ncbi:MAG: gamma-glutamyltransferase [Phycisphaeraceae bacterium]|nr:gamma-glutamyltransferase [Phycisphaeraceae bacterium]